MALSRRDFLIGTLGAGTALPLAGCLGPAIQANRHGFPCRRLGRTGELVTIVGLGCAYAQSSGGRGGMAALIEAALEGGIRYFDTSSDYTRSEEILGRVVKPLRDEVFITTKLNALTARAAEVELATSLKRLQTDHVDLLLQHGAGCQVDSADVDTVLSIGGSLEFLIDAKRKGARIAGYGAPGKGNTLLNYCGIRTDLVEYTVDRNPYKHGRFCPGTHIPIFSPERLEETKPDFILILPWNLKKEILEQLSYARDWGARFVVPIPELEIVD